MVEHLQRTFSRLTVQASQNDAHGLPILVFDPAKPTKLVAVGCYLPAVGYALRTRVPSRPNRYLIVLDCSDIHSPETAKKNEVTSRTHRFSAWRLIHDEGPFTGRGWRTKLLDAAQKLIETHWP